tara:strand:+ start:39 stop:338 length:300 start_codon:yes stop_codon:yes gene_type:complete
MSKIKKISLTKKDISKKINLETGLSNSYSYEIINDLIDILKSTIRDKETNIKNFVTFKILSKNERLGRNPKNNKDYLIKARKSLSITVSKYLNEKIKKL